MLLIGFMGAGKTAVGRALAGELGWRLIDFDAEVERRSGRSIPEIFRTEGEKAFREIEAEVGQDALREQEVVLAAGGGWAAVPDRLTAVPPGTFSVWLRVGPEEALRRAGEQAGLRPLLSVEEPLVVARRLLEERRPYYSAANLGVDTEGSSVEDVTAQILRALPGRATTTETE